ncbi:hypothetical protein GXW77_08215 [Roseomonas alkaliterrae]|uniref:Uncharacterized protein n=1 Tax=Neoroseomonas alkaliterrae TaxID=1452450 RepID=A0A840YCN0_9PROT|nr:hypothetical protein [Neoroseomonas alkaliterrae]MBB5691654.1 hypothetical protein [Neoroseomonas alkaliterrae]MBR0676157.1 hypothetical protein [Neoroseomonas alkaliterrae]
MSSVTSRSAAEQPLLERAHPLEIPPDHQRPAAGQRRGQHQHRRLRPVGAADRAFAPAGLGRHPGEVAGDALPPRRGQQVVLRAGAVGRHARLDRQGDAAQAGQRARLQQHAHAALDLLRRLARGEACGHPPGHAAHQRSARDGQKQVQQRHAEGGGPREGPARGRLSHRRG